ncbi:platelet glycoprotein 4 [Patella vulgata]|uniref:platelet glycoprotein 4 n=1 Tax=Patella vulgata TaxID=6465 RepID=UPI0021808806|nr:platelet glycoprotein 4 [Patella vulgata]
MGRKSTIGTVCCGVLGLVFLIVGLAMIPVFKNLIKKKIKDNIPIARHSETFEDFITPPAPIYFQIWVFDVVNHLEVIKDGAKPYLYQKGPYTYREERLKVNVTFHDNNTVSYRENRWFVFEEELSAGPQSDNFTTVNIPVALIDNLIKNEYGWIQDLVELLFQVTAEDVFITLSVEDLMWGYEDHLLRRAAEILANFNITFDDHFGLFKGQNGTDDGLYTVFTGKGDSSKHGVINEWNKMKTLPYWTSATAAMINGSDGTMYPPFLDQDKPIYVFSSDVCRSLNLVYKYDYDLKDIKVYRFVAPPSLFENSTANPANKGFCTKAEGCLPSGVVDVSACRSSAPIVLSQPHFLAADPSIINSVIGLHPNTEEHQTVLDVEPMTGTTMNAAKKLQINIHIMNVSHIVDTTKVKSMFLPVLWLNESAVIDNKSAGKFKDKVQQPVKITQAIQFGLITVGVFVLVCALAFVGKKMLCKSNNEPSDLQPMIT